MGSKENNFVRLVICNTDLNTITSSLKYSPSATIAGGNPYEGLTGEEVFKYIANGHRLRRTSEISPELYVE